MDDQSIFLAALQKGTPEERAEFVALACSDDEVLRENVESLLRAHSRLGQGDFLEERPLSLQRTLDHAPVADSGTLIGPYKIRELLGEGGMGEVYVAEQTEPVRRKVALKIIRPGMATRDVVARFEAERQALAMMDHPNIAKVFDAGTTGEGAKGGDGERGRGGESFRQTPLGFSPSPHLPLSSSYSTGQPYFVMELVQGLPITEYCDQQRLSTTERLKLFATVCRAVQHAHQKGIIHRDLKPSNVLVPEIDGVAVPKVIDFGVAKAVSQKLSKETVYTHFAQVVGTPLYMSPEQAGLGVVDIDTRSDVYSLGVLLYELLTGQTPFDSQTLKQAGFDEMQRIIREEEPRRPSAMVSTLEAAALSTVADRRGSDPRRLPQSLAGELDWIVMKCLEKDRNRRYETPNSLARDIERYLHDEAVQACPPSTSYRVRKFALRNKTLLGAGGAIATALCIGLGLSAWMYVRAATERARATAVSDVLQEILASYNPHLAKDSQNSVPELMDDFSAGLGDQLAGEPEVEAAIRSAIGKSRWRLGVYGRAEPAAETEFAISYAWLANFLTTSHREEEAKAVLRKAADHLDRAAKRGLAPAFHINALFYLAIARLRLGDEAGYRQTCAAMLHVPTDSADDSVPYQRLWIWCLGPHPGEDLSVQLKQAEELATNNSFDSFGHPYIHLGVLGGLLYRAGQYEQAAQRLNDSIAAHHDDPLRAFRTALDRQLLLAMTKWQLGQQDDARRHLAEIQPALDEWLRSPSSFWLRRAQLEVLRQEAEALIDQHPAKKAPSNDNLTPVKTLNPEP